MKKVFSIIFAAALVLSPVSTLLIPQSVSAQTAETPEQKRARLESELAGYEAEIKEKEAELSKQQQQTGSLKKDVSVLTAEINAAKAKIKARAVAIEKLSDDISSKNQTIGQLNEKINNQKQSLAQLVRKTNQLDEANVVHIILSSQNLSRFYSDVDSFSSIKESIRQSVSEIEGARSNTEAQKQSLEQAQNQELDAKADLESSKRKVETSEAEKQKLLSISKNQEAAYQTVLKQRREKAAQIRAALFALRDSAAIPFGKALEYATNAGQKTGVRPAFLLAILTQESNLGENTGSCYVTDTVTGAGIGAKSGRVIQKVMSPTRDIPPFIQILAGLGQDPYKMLVSCPQSIGWGGAMGPAQFIPSTWIMYQNRLASVLGVSVPNPWEPRDAFMASALFLADLGADSGTYSSERNAACRYYSGKVCSGLSQAANYGDSVMGKAASIQENQIDLLNNI